jgi:hypothetical protein
MLAAAGDPGAAETFEAATRAFRDLGSPYHLAVGLMDHADYLAASGDQTTGRELATEAEAIAERLSARPVLSRAQELTASTAAGLADHTA